jgi:ferredoxin
VTELHTPLFLCDTILVMITWEGGVFLKSKRFASADKKVCVACGSCVLVCPKQAITVVKGCYANVDKDLCVGCGRCAGICPAGCISVKERGAGDEKEVV